MNLSERFIARPVGTTLLAVLLGWRVWDNWRQAKPAATPVVKPKIGV